MNRSLARSAVLTGLGEVLRDLGCDPESIVAQAGLPARCLTDPDIWVPNFALRRAFEIAVDATGAEDIGLRMAEKRRFSNLGAVALLASNQPTMGDMLDSLGRSFHLQNPAVSLELDRGPQQAEFRVKVRGASPSSAIYGVDLMLGVIYLALLKLVDSQWRPAGVCLRRARPADIKPFLSFFDSVLIFGHDFDGMLLNAEDLKLPLPRADADLARSALTLLGAQIPTEPETKRRMVSRLIESMLGTGYCTAEEISFMLGMSRRTLHRMLASEDTSFEVLLNEVRGRLVETYLDNSSLPLSEVSDRLGFSTQSSFSHWYKGLHGYAPSQRKSRRLIG